MTTTVTSDGWRSQAACVGMDGLFFDAARADAARAVCSACPVEDECRDDAVWDSLEPLLRISNDRIRGGVRGGTTATERDGLRGRRRQCRECGDWFDRGDTSRQLCSADCQRAARRRYDRPPRPAPPVDVPSPHRVDDAHATDRIGRRKNLDALMSLVAVHYQTEGSHPDRQLRWSCRGWGAVTTGNDMPAGCAACGLGAAGLVMADGSILCWACAFWAHAPACPHWPTVTRRALGAAR
jgi:hypothetical protein